MDLQEANDACNGQSVSSVESANFSCFIDSLWSIISTTRGHGANCTEVNVMQINHEDDAELGVGHR